MKKTFFKNLFRDIKKTLSRFLSIVIIIAIGVAFYAGVRATSPDMKKSADAYFNEAGFMDFKLISTLGLTKDDLTKVQKLKGVKKVQGSCSIDVIVEKDKHSLVLNVNSTPPKNGINQMKIITGRLPKANNEVVVEKGFLKANNFKIGDIIELKSGNDANKIGDTLKISKFKIVGEALSPLYLSAQRQLSSVGNGSVKGFLYILPEVFKSDYYTEIYLKMDNDLSKDSLISNAEYKVVSKNMEQSLKNFGVIRSKARYTQIVSDASDKIKTAQEKLNKSKKEAKDKFSEASKKLNDAKSKIDNGKVELQKNQTIYNQKKSQGEKQIAQVKKTLNESSGKLNLGKQRAAANITSSIGLKVDEAKKQLDSDPNNKVFIAQYNGINQIYLGSIKGKDFETMYTSLKNSGAIVQMKPYFDIQLLKNKFDSSKSQIDTGRQQLNQQVKLLENGRLEIDAARIKLADGEKEVDQNIEKVKSEEKKANIKIKDGQLKINENKDKIKDIKSPEWFVLGRSVNLGYESYRQDSDRIDNIGKAFPLIFFLVAALVSLTTMTRMVQENRMEIGTFKALGYSRTAITTHYLIYALLASITGTLVGISFGFRLFPPLIMNAYGTLYAIPSSLTPFNTGLALQASLIAIIFTSLAAVAASLEELREAPSSLMRPKPPKAGKTILLERVTFIWKRLSFTNKVTARNIFRYKQRFFMTVIGIAVCTGLMITGFGMKSGIIGAAKSQFIDIYKYDMLSTFRSDIEGGKTDTTKDKIMKDSNVKSVLFSYTKNATVDLYKSGREDAYVVVTEDKNEINKYIKLTSTKGDELKLNDNGVIITEKLSKLMNKKVGDTFEVTINDKVVKTKISGITQHYLQHYIYMSPDYYKKLTGEKLKFNGFYGLLKSITDSSEDKTTKALTAIEDVGSVSYKNKSNLILIKQQRV